MTEIVDIVDENDHVIGQAPRTEVHAKGLRHRFVTALVRNSQGQILLQWRSHRKAIFPRMFDSSVGGHVIAGQSYEDAILQEAQEELGLQLAAPPQLMGDIAYCDPGSENMVGKAFLIHHDGPFTGWEAEADRLEWFSPAELRPLINRLPYLFCQNGTFELYEQWLEKQGAP